MISKRKRLISESEPTNLTISSFTASQVARGATEFLDDNFSGAVSYEIDLKTHTCVMLSPDGLAYFFKYLLNAIFGNTVVNISFSETDTDFLITTEWKCHRELLPEELHELKMIAYAAGFNTIFSSRGDMRLITLSTKCGLSEKIYVYANGYDKIKNAFKRVFFSI